MIATPAHRVEEVEVLVIDGELDLLTERDFPPPVDRGAESGPEIVGEQRRVVVAGGLDRGPGGVGLDTWRVEREEEIGEAAELLDHRPGAP